MKSLFYVIALLTASNLLAADTRANIGIESDVRSARKAQHTASDGHHYSQLIASSAIAGVATLRLIAAANTKRQAASSLWFNDIRRAAIHASAWNTNSDFAGYEHTPSTTEQESCIALSVADESAPTLASGPTHCIATTEIPLPLLPRPPPVV